MFYMRPGPVVRALAGIALLFILLFSETANTQTSVETAIEEGKKIYRKGLLSDGQPLQAIGQSGLKVTGVQTTCANCHRRSGYGSSEGSIIAPAIHGKVLYTAREIQHRELASTRRSGVGVRPAYTDETLSRAIRKGIGADGRSLGQFMPRFDLSDGELDSLIVYLKVLGNEKVQGVTEEYFDFATIITPGVSETRKIALLRLFQIYINHINSGTRNESRKAKNSPWHKSWHYEAYRKWRLHVWELTGEPESWNKQLVQFYQKQPVFALLNGLGGPWKNIHKFCESNEIPCLFPTTEFPDNTGSGFYSLYFSKGVYLEAELIANHRLQTRDQHIDTVIQVYRDGDTRGIGANNYLNKLLSKNNSVQLMSYKIAKSDLNAKKTLQKIISNASPYDLVLWGDYPDLLKQLKNNDTKTQPDRIYLSTRFSNNSINVGLPRQYDGVYLLHRFALPGKQKQHSLRFSSWARINKLSITDEHVMANAFFTLTVLVDAIRHIRNNISREYLIERIEHMVDNTVFHSVYAHLSLGPNQRYASKGGYVIKYNINNSPMYKEAKWIVP